MKPALVPTGLVFDLSEISTGPRGTEASTVVAPWSIVVTIAWFHSSRMAGWKDASWWTPTTTATVTSTMSAVPSTDAGRARWRAGPSEEIRGSGGGASSPVGSVSCPRRASASPTITEAPQSTETQISGPTSQHTMVR